MKVFLQSPLIDADPPAIMNSIFFKENGRSFLEGQYKTNGNLTIYHDANIWGLMDFSGPKKLVYFSGPKISGFWVH